MNQLQFLWLICWGARTQKLKRFARKHRYRVDRTNGWLAPRHVRAHEVLGKGGGQDASSLHPVNPPSVRRPQRRHPTAQARVPAPHGFLSSRDPRPCTSGREFLRATPFSSARHRRGNTAHARAAHHACSARPPIEMRAGLGQSLSAGCGRCLSAAAHAPGCPTGRGQCPSRALPGLGSSASVLSRVRLGAAR